MPDAPRFCAACGKQLVPEGRFCPFCGTPAGGAGPAGGGRSARKWLDDLVSHDGARRGKALRALLDLGAEADPDVARLAAALKEERPEGLPAEALLQLGRHVDDAVRHILVGMTRDESPDVRATHFGSLMKCGERAAPAVPALREALRDAVQGRSLYSDVGVHAARALGWIGPAADGAVFELLDALKQHRDPRLREAAAWSLGRLGARAKSAVPELMEARRDPDPAVAKEAVKSLKLVR